MENISTSIEYLGTPIGLVEKSLSPGQFSIVYDPKTGEWSELAGYDKDGSEVWISIP